jgi:hypothetical protein
LDEIIQDDRRVTVHKLRRALRDKSLGRNIIILHDNARPHAARLTLEAIATMGWEVLPTF